MNRRLISNGRKEKQTTGLINLPLYPVVGGGCSAGLLLPFALPTQAVSQYLRRTQRSGYLLCTSDASAVFMLYTRSEYDESDSQTARLGPSPPSPFLILLLLSGPG